jgi:hypothetical protein
VDWWSCRRSSLVRRYPRANPLDLWLEREREREREGRERRRAKEEIDRVREIEKVVTADSEREREREGGTDKRETGKERKRENETREERDGDAERKQTEQSFLSFSLFSLQVAFALRKTLFSLAAQVLETRRTPGRILQESGRDSLMSHQCRKRKRGEDKRVNEQGREQRTE